LKILVLFFSVYLFATQAHIKYSPASEMLYIYLQSRKSPKTFELPNVNITNGKLTLVKKFNYFYNGKFYVGLKYKVEFANTLEISPLMLKYNGKTYKTNKFTYSHKLPKIPPPKIEIKTTNIQSDFYTITIYAILLYLIGLFIIYIFKYKKIYSTLGLEENDIKKFYYYLAISGFREVEILNKEKNLFKKTPQEFPDIVEKVIDKLINKEKFFIEAAIFFLLFCILLVIKEKM